MRKIAMTIASIVLLASISQAQISQVTVKVDGLACAFCAYGLQKGLKRVEGVRDVKVHVDAGKAELQFKKGVSAGRERDDADQQHPKPTPEQEIGQGRKQ